MTIKTKTYLSTSDVMKTAKCGKDAVIRAVEKYGDLTPSAKIQSGIYTHYGFELGEVMRWMQNRRKRGIQTGQRAEVQP